jgi:hypothetical protein
LLDENESLRGRLKNVVQSPLSDAEKQQIIDESHRLHNSAPASMAIPNVRLALMFFSLDLSKIKSYFVFFQNNDIEGTTCSTPEWDKHSTSSEISVACLQDKIIQVNKQTKLFCMFSCVCVETFLIFIINQKKIQNQPNYEQLHKISIFHAKKKIAHSNLRKVGKMKKKKNTNYLL